MRLSIYANDLMTIILYHDNDNNNNNDKKDKNYFIIISRVNIHIRNKKNRQKIKLGQIKKPSFTFFHAFL